MRTRLAAVALLLLLALLAVFVIGVLAPYRRGRPLPLEYVNGRGGVATFGVRSGRLLRIESGEPATIAAAGSLRVLHERTFGSLIVAELPLAASAAAIFYEDYWELVAGGRRVRIAGRAEALRALAARGSIRLLPAEREPGRISDDFMRVGQEAGAWSVLAGAWALTAGADPERSSNPFYMAYQPAGCRSDPMLAERVEREKHGIGLTLGGWRGADFVARISAQGPAARAGVQEEDIVVSADGLVSRQGMFGNPSRESVRMTIFRPASGKMLRYNIPKEPYRWGEALRPEPLAGSAAGAYGIIAAGRIDWCEGEAAVSVRPGAAGAAGIAWRVASADDFLAARLVGAAFDGSGSRLEIVHWQAGRMQVLAARPYPVWPEAFYRLSTRLVADTFSVAVDGTDVLSAPAPAAVGNLGMCAWSRPDAPGGPAPVLFDDFCYHAPERESQGQAARPEPAAPHESRSEVMTREEAMFEWASSRGEWRRSGDFYFYVFPLYDDFGIRLGSPRRVLLFAENSAAWQAKTLAPGAAVLDLNPARSGEFVPHASTGLDIAPAGGAVRSIQRRDGRFEMHGADGRAWRSDDGRDSRWLGLAVGKQAGESAFPDDVSVVDSGAWDERFEAAPAGVLFTAGFWGVANKWVCDPRFSWLAARTTETAQAWWKGVVEGDFTFDCYIATFMEMTDEPFERNGDYGIALSERLGDLGAGYFLAIGEQFDARSRLYRGRQVLAESSREEHQLPANHLYLPLRQEFHRRWSHLRFQRRGRRLAYELDGKRVLEAADDAPLAARYLAIMSQRNGFLVSRVRLTGDIRQGLPQDALPEPPAHYDDGRYTNLWAGIPQVAVENKSGLVTLEQRVSGPFLLSRTAPFRLDEAPVLLLKLKPLAGDLRVGVYVLPYNPPAFHWEDEYGDGALTNRDIKPPGAPYYYFRPRLFDQGLLLYVPVVGEFEDNAPFTKVRNVQRVVHADGSIEVTARLELPYLAGEYAVSRGQCIAVLGCLHLDDWASAGVFCNRPGSRLAIERFDVLSDPEAREPLKYQADTAAAWQPAPFLVNCVAPRRWRTGEAPPGQTDEAALIARGEALFLTASRWGGRTRLRIEDDWRPLEFPVFELEYRAGRRVAVSPSIWPPGFSLIWGDGADDRTEWAMGTEFVAPVPATPFLPDDAVHTARFNLLRSVVEGHGSEVPESAALALADAGWHGTYPGIGFELRGMRLLPVVSGRPAHITPVAISRDWRMSIDTEPATEPAGKSLVLPAESGIFPWRRLLLEAAGVHVIPDTALAEGRNYVHFRAQAADGTWQPAEHWPFIVDTTGPRVRFAPAAAGDAGLLFGHFAIDDQMGLASRSVELEVTPLDGPRHIYTVGRGLVWQPEAGALRLVASRPPGWCASPVLVMLRGVADTLGNRAPQFGPLVVYLDGRVTLLDTELRPADADTRAAEPPVAFFVPDMRQELMVPADVRPMLGGPNYFEENLGRLRPLYNVKVERVAGAGLAGGFGGRIQAWPGEWSVEMLDRYLDPRAEPFFVMSYRIEGAVERLWLKLKMVAGRSATYPIADVSPGWHTAAFDISAAMNLEMGRLPYPYILRIDLVGECGGIYDAAKPAGAVYVDALGAAGWLLLRIATVGGSERVEAFWSVAAGPHVKQPVEPAPLRFGIHAAELFGGRWLSLYYRPLGAAEMRRFATVDLHPVAPQP